MECKNTYYEIIELYPSELNAKIPLIQILRGISYYILLLLENILALITFKHSIAQYFSKKEKIKGRESNQDMAVDIEKISGIKKDKVKETISNYLSRKESEKKIKELI